MHSGNEATTKRSGAFDWVLERPFTVHASKPVDKVSLSRRATQLVAPPAPAIELEGAARRANFDFAGRRVLEIARHKPCLVPRILAPPNERHAVLILSRAEQSSAIDPALYRCFHGSLANFAASHGRAFDAVASWEPQMASEAFECLPTYAGMLRTGGHLLLRVAPASPNDTWVSLSAVARRRGLVALDLHDLSDHTLIVTFQR